MSELVGELQGWLIGLLPYAIRLGIVALAVLVLAALIVPISVLFWWAGWTRRPDPVPTPSRLGDEPPGHPYAHFLVYLSGMGDISGEYSTRYEDAFLAAIAARVPGLAVIDDVFGFSVTNQAMTSQRLLGWFWRWVNTQRLKKRGPLKITGRLIFLRNILHIAVSADPRYGPVYNYGTAEMILAGLLRHGYALGSGAPLTLLGYSGGAQIALASSGYLKATLHAPVQVISLAGIMDSHPAIDQIDGVYHLYGSRDYQQRLGDLIFPSRWPIFPGSRWNRALAAGKIRRICIGPMDHAGSDSYMDATETLEDGVSYLDRTAETVAGLVRGLG